MKRQKPAIHQFTCVLTAPGPTWTSVQRDMSLYYNEETHVYFRPAHTFTVLLFTTVQLK